MLLHGESLSRQMLDNRLNTWSKEHEPLLETYYVQTGQVTSTRRNSSGDRYLELAQKARIIASLAGMYRATRVGLVLYALVKHYKQAANPFFLSDVERVFYVYHLLMVDADLFLTVLDLVLNSPNSNLSTLQKGFQAAFLNRLDEKSSGTEEQLLKQTLLERRLSVSATWAAPERYAEHLVPPRLNWMLDLELLDPQSFQNHRYVLTATGNKLLAKMPRIGSSPLHDVTDKWLSHDFWSASTAAIVEVLEPKLWSHIDEADKDKFLLEPLREVFQFFRYSVVPRVSLAQATIYLSSRLLLDQHVLVSPDDLQTWLSSRKIGKWHYQVRYSPRENESYILASLGD